MRVLLSISVSLCMIAAAAPASAAGRYEILSRTHVESMLADDEGADDEAPDGDDEAPDGGVFVERFTEDPRLAPDIVISGQPLDRIDWSLDEPAWPGDSPGSLAASYLSNAPAGLFGFPLPAAFDETDTFTAAAAFVIHSAGFNADPNAFFQISWGLWSTSATGLERTGSFQIFAGDTFELVAFDWFPNISPIEAFGGPFLSPAVFGAADVADPSFPSAGSFANFVALFGLEVDLPRDTPLLAVLEHRPELDAMSVQVYRILSSEAVLPLDGAVGVVPLAGLDPRHYRVDAIGLMLWHDGFGGPTPAVTAELSYHALVAAPGLARPEDWLHAGD